MCVPTWEAVSALPAWFGRGLVGGIGAAHHTNGQDPVVFCEAKRGDGGHQPTQRRALLVNYCREPTRQRGVLQQDQERYRYTERRSIQLLIQRLDRQYILWEWHAPWRAGRFPVKHIQSSGGRGAWLRSGQVAGVDLLGLSFLARDHQWQEGCLRCRLSKRFGCRTRR